MASKVRVGSQQAVEQLHSSYKQGVKAYSKKTQWKKTQASKAFESLMAKVIPNPTLATDVDTWP
jgi:hypothetical protein